MQGDANQVSEAEWCGLDELDELINTVRARVGTVLEAWWGALPDPVYTRTNAQTHKRAA